MPKKLSSPSRLLKAVVLAVAVVQAVACGPLRMGRTPRAEIIFTNESFDQADVYAYAGSSNPVRIGTVMSNRTETLAVPESVIGAGGTINIVARRLAHSSTQSSGALTLRAGERIQIRLPATGGALIVLPARD